ncbi:hypothetical protein OESDEN_10372 [Oesophagostomum dentatum]|uniref:Transposase Tc1-like domain-containing protein n=1 Tax=Oesophagostomum dentatum TaxID=61180 RepID=A0A0B1SWW4_OESDE|nr:hypothetical protein OESDEN_10372 [Oesophagostomum dentatum]
MRKAPRLTARHKALRLRFASENIERDWTKVVFSDEKSSILMVQMTPSFTGGICAKARFSLAVETLEEAV